MSALYPQPETDDTRNGEASHWYAEMRLRNQPAASVAPNGVILNDEMREAAMIYVRHVRTRVAQLGPDVEWNVEKFRFAPLIHPKHAGGTVDSEAISRRHRSIDLWNYKFGHREVHAFENWQETGYVANVVDYLKLNGHQDQDWTVNIHIVQPRCYTARGDVRTWTVKLSDLRGAFNKLTAAAAEACKPNPRTISGEHCFDCSARHACEASRKMTMASVDYIGKSIPEPLNAGAVSFELNTLRRAKDAVEGRLTMVEQQAEMMIRQGVLVPGFGLEPTKPRLAWKYPIEVIKTIGVMHNIPTVKESLITPTQAIDAGIDAAVISQYADRGKAGLKLKVQNPDDISPDHFTNGAKLMLQLLTPVGRIVRGHPMRASEQKDRITKLPKLNPDGTKKINYYCAIAFAKTDPAFAQCKAQIEQQAHTDWPRGEYNGRGFSWKIIDGDGVDDKGQPYNRNEGYAGHWVMTVSQGWAYQVINTPEKGNVPITDPNDIKCGYFARVYITVKGNAPSETPGMYINPQFLQLMAYGPEIVQGIDPSEVLAQHAGQPVALPAGASAFPVPPAAVAPMPGLPGAPVQPAYTPPPVANFPGMPGAVAPPAPMPHPSIMTPPAPPPPAPVPVAAWSPPAGWLPHPQSPGYFYNGQQVATQQQLGG